MLNAKATVVCFLLLLSSAYGSRPVTTFHTRHLLQTSSVQTGKLVPWGYMNVDGYVPDLSQKDVKDISLGPTVAVSLLQTGVANAWGDNTFGQLNIPTTLKVANVSVGYTNILMLLDNGTAISYGERSSSPTVPVSNAVAVAAGLQMSMVLLADNTVSVYGQISPVPTAVQGQVAAISVAVQRDGGTDKAVAYAILKDGTLSAWGNTTNTNYIPPQMNGVVVKQVEGRYRRVLAKLENDTIVSWRLIGTTDYSVISRDGANIASMDAYADVIHLTDSTGTVNSFTAGNAAFTAVASIAPPELAGIVAKSLTWGGFSLFATKSGTAQALGPIKTKAYATSAVGASVQRVSLGEDHVLALMSDGQVLAYGQADFNQTTAPRTVNTGSSDIAAGLTHCLAITSTGSVEGWGDAQFNATSAPDVTRFKTVRVAASNRSSFALLNTGQVIQWGQPVADAWTTPPTSNVSTIVATIPSAAALLTNGTVVEWNTSYLSVPAAVRSNVVFLSGGWFGYGAVLSSGTVVVWDRTSQSRSLTFTDYPQAPNATAVYLHVSNIASKQRFRVYIKLNNNGLLSLNEALFLRQNRVVWDVERNATGEVLDMSCSKEFDAAVVFGSPPLFVLDTSSGSTDTGSNPPSNVDGNNTPANQSGSGSSGVSAGAIGGIIAGVVVAVAAVGGVAFYMMRKRRRERADLLAKQEAEAVKEKLRGQKPLSDTGAGHTTDLVYRPRGDTAVGPTRKKIPGLTDGEVFTRATALAYTWAPETVASNDCKQYIPVESGINDVHLDNMISAEVKEQVLQQQLSAGPQSLQYLVAKSPVIQLTRDELTEQIQLCTDGLMGRGATALVFKCLWPSRFGNALLAAKVLKDGYESDMEVLQSFCYEAGVLANSVHPNIVRLYGYCLEPPNVCLILELLPISLKDLMYKPIDDLRSNTLLGITADGSSSWLATAIAAAHAANAAMASQAATTMSRSGVTGSSVPTMAGSTFTNSMHTNNTASTVGGTATTLTEVKPVAGNAPPVSPFEEPQGTSTAVAAADTSPGEIQMQLSKAPDGDTTTSTAGNTTQNGHDTRTTADTNTSTTQNGRSTKTSTNTDTNTATNASSSTKKTEDTIGFTALENALASTSNASEARASSAQSFQSTLAVNRLTLLQVLRVSSDVSAGLAFLHNRPTAGSAHLGMSSVPSNLANQMSSGFLVEMDAAIRGTKVVHRDLKPANVLINSRGIAKISDFGLAREHQKTTLQTVHLAAGTLPYMAPELLCAVNANHATMPATNKVDVYSLGMMMWEMLSGTPPWKGSSEAALIAAVVSGRHPPLPSTKDESLPADAQATGSLPASLNISPELNAIIQQCWQLREHRRPSASTVHQKTFQLLKQHE